MSQKILIIAHDFPPYGGGGVMRMIKFIKYMPQFGFSPVVLTINPYSYWNKDYSLLDEISYPLKIVRTFTFETRGYNIKLQRKVKNGSSLLRHILKSVSKNIFIPDYQAIWIPFAFLKARRIIKQLKIKYVLVTSPPNSAQITGLLLKKHFKKDISIIRDFRDFWTDCPVFRRQKTVLTLKIEEFLEKKCIINSDKIVTATSFIEKYLSEKHSIKNNITTITNGFDDEDFKNNPIPDNKNIFRIIYAGSLNEWRNPEFFFKAVSEIVNNRDDIPEISIEFYGFFPESYKSLIHKYDLNEIIKIRPHVPHKNCIEIMQQADLLLLIIDKLEGEGTLTGKFFEYIGCRKPILGLVPENDLAADWINKCKLGFTSTLYETDKIIENLLKFLKKEFIFKPEIEYDTITRKYLTEKLVDFIKG